MGEPGTHAPADTFSVRGILWDIALNALIPLALYRLSKRYVSSSELTALALATTFPFGKSIFDVVKKRQLDPVSIIVLLGIGASALALLAGASPSILLVRESLFTVAFGLACFGSLLLPRPLMFYFGRHFMAEANPERIRRFEAGWALPDVRFAHRLITVVWGSVYLAEFSIRVTLIYLLPAAWVLTISPVLLGGMTVGTIFWTFRYARKIRERAAPKINRILNRSLARE